ncbi:CAF17-like 4Fe-4S cluster assembly/insertion protein YgfZ [Agrilutibacter solisilvae]|uniref:Folate-binding protein YgfZ n=1 Tax=Agrilutibacter solisilvae TaxID=2763317 RepID=A0A974XYK9_9GAMM|nr:folate-binding protein YgfZ [Lysobacter solisilvae]QSX78186.1 folate-binding protein YgfZ [Lysobacter solisilvae]
MHDNPQASPGAAFALPDHRAVSLSGRDAAAFAQAQFMNDLTALAPGQWQWSGWLTPKGRVIALFALLRVEAEHVLLVLPDADPVTFAAALQRFVFRSKVTIAVREDLRAEGAFTTPAMARGAQMGGSPGAGLELDAGADGGARTLRLVSTSTAGHDPAEVAAWAAFDLEHGLPRLPSSQSDHWTPQQLSLERLAAFSVKKGCYPGQEIVARTHFLGKVKRGLMLLESDVSLAAGSDVHGPDGMLGHLVAAAPGPSHLALAVVPLEHPHEALTVDGAPVRERPLRAGLAR